MPARKRLPFTIYLSGFGALCGRSLVVRRFFPDFCYIEPMKDSRWHAKKLDEIFNEGIEEILHYFGTIPEPFSKIRMGGDGSDFVPYRSAWD